MPSLYSYSSVSDVIVIGSFDRVPPNPKKPGFCAPFFVSPGFASAAGCASAAGFASPGAISTAPTSAGNATASSSAASASKLQSVVATGSVRIDQGTKWAVGGKATFDQSNRTLVLTENPVMHDGPNEVAGDRVVVFLDQDRSIVEGGRKRVKAVLFPGKNDGAPAAGGKPQAATAAANAPASTQ